MKFFALISAKDCNVSKSEKTVLFCVNSFIKGRAKNLFFTIFLEKYHRNVSLHLR